jgi:hypothetical protein
MSINDNSRNGYHGVPVHLDELPELGLPETPPQSPPKSSTACADTTDRVAKPPVASFATRANIENKEGTNKNKLLVLGGGLMIAVLFFVFTAVVGRSPKKQTVTKQASQESKREKPQQKGSVTPLMETVRTPAPDNAGGQIRPSDIKRNRSTDGGAINTTNSDLTHRTMTAKTVIGGSLGSVPSFSDTQQRWEEPQPYGTTPTATAAPQTQQQSTLKEPSLVFVRSLVQGQVSSSIQGNLGRDDAPLLEMTPGTRIQAKLETQVSSAVQVPVVAVVEYTYAIGDRVVVPAGAHVYGQLQQADRSGLVSVKFDEIELLDGAREKIDAIGTGLDLGPIRGTVSGKNSGKNFLIRTASGISSVATMLVGNNTSSTFSEDDLLRERVAQNIP